jgi:hypothetical protein
MKFRLLAATAAVGVAMATNASAAITIDHLVGNQLFALDSGVMLWDFDAIADPNTSYSGAAHPAVPDGFNVTDSAPPPFEGPGSVSVCCQDGDDYDADPTNYGSVQNEETPPGETFTALNGYSFRSFSFYMGSPDTYNRLTFNFANGDSQVFQGINIWGGPAFGGDRTKGFRVYYDFNGRAVTSINFRSTVDAFEFDGLAGTLAIPEPTTWALMILGFGGAGAMLRRRRAALA